MKVHIKYYAKYRDSTGKKEEDLDVGEITIKELLALLRSKYPGMRRDSTSLVALNNEFHGEEFALSEGDTVSVFPPVSGG